MANTSGIARTRVITALVLAAAVLLLIWAPALQAGFGVVVALFVFQGLREFHALARIKGIPAEPYAGIVAGTAVGLSAMAGRPELTAGVLCVGAVALGSLHVVEGRLSLTATATAVFGMVYLGWFAAHVTLLRLVPGTGPGLVTLLVATVSLTDSGAYIVGSMAGRHKMAPTVSPNKTWEGAAGGFVLSVAVMGVAYALRAGFTWEALPAWSLTRYLATGAVISVVAQFGDLTESAFKRDAGVKDSGTIFPGHGGMLDRCDGFLFAAPVLYYLSTSW